MEDQDKQRELDLAKLKAKLDEEFHHKVQLEEQDKVNVFNYSRVLYTNITILHGLLIAFERLIGTIFICFIYWFCCVGLSLRVVFFCI